MTFLLESFRANLKTCTERRCHWQGDDSSDGFMMLEPASSAFANIPRHSGVTHLVFGGDYFIGTHYRQLGGYGYKHQRAYSEATDLVGANTTRDACSGVRFVVTGHRDRDRSLRNMSQDRSLDNRRMAGISRKDWNAVTDVAGLPPCEHSHEYARAH